MKLLILFLPYLVACEVLRANMSMIKEAHISLDMLIDRMFQEGIISNEDKREITDERSGLKNDQRMDKLLQILQSTVSLDLDGSTFTWFIEVLRDLGAKRMTGLADKLEREYQEKANINTPT